MMSDSRLIQADRPTVTRRSFLKVTGAGAAGGALLAMLDARQAPAQLKGTSLRVILWSHFVPAYDAWIDDFAKKWGEQNGATVRIDHIPHLELPTRYAAEFAAGAGHDLIYFAGQILTGQYYRHLVDLSDLANDLGTRYGPWMPRSEEHTSELQSQSNLVCRLLLEKKKKIRHPKRQLQPNLPPF